MINNCNKQIIKIINKHLNTIYLILIVNKDNKNNSDFEFFDYIPYFHKNEYYFNMMGKLEINEFRSKTKILRDFPKHLKITLFQKDERIKKIRNKEFKIVFFADEEIKEKANNLWKKKQYKKAINYFVFAYSVFKWLELIENNKGN